MSITVMAGSVNYACYSLSVCVCAIPPSGLLVGPQGVCLCFSFVSVVFWLYEGLSNLQGGNSSNRKAAGQKASR